MTDKKVVVTGLGIVTSIGCSTSEFLKNCRQGVLGIVNSACHSFDTSNLRTNYWGQISDFCEKTDSIYSVREQWLRNRAIARHAADEALLDAGLTSSYISSLGNHSAIVTASLSYEDYLYDYFLHQQYEHRDHCTEALHEDFFWGTAIKRYCGVEGSSYHFSSACAAGTSAIGAGMDLIRFQQCELVFICGIDVLSEMVAYGFHSLKALSRDLCHPLDASRDGINIGEGCGFLVLESERHALARNAGIYAECMDYALGNEAFHLTSPDTSGEGFYSSMKKALDRAQLLPQDIDYINLHGTGTPVNDSVELNAITKLYENSSEKPYISSLKSLIGHCMGAAGTLEAILTILCLKEQFYLPIYNISAPIEELCQFQIQPPARSIRYALSNSFGFAGNTASIIFGRYPQTSFSPPRSPVSESSVWINGIGIITEAALTISDLKSKLGFSSEASAISYAGSGELPAPTKGISSRKLRGLHPISRMTLSSALQALSDADAAYESWNPYEVGTLFSSHYGAANTRNQYAVPVLNHSPDLCNPTTFANVSPNAPLGHLAMNFHAKGFSASLHSNCPLPLAFSWLKNGMCQRLFHCVAEEYNVPIHYHHEINGKGHKEPCQKHCITFFMERQKSLTSYCQLKNIYCCSIGSDPLLDASSLSASVQKESCKNINALFQTIIKNEHAPDYLFLSDCGTPFDRTEKELLQTIFPDCPIISSRTVLGSLQPDTFSGNIAIAALCLKHQSIPDILLADSPHPPQNIMVTGYDSCGTYHVAVLTA